MDIIEPQGGFWCVDDPITNKTQGEISVPKAPLVMLPVEPTPKDMFQSQRHSGVACPYPKLVEN